MLATLLPAQRLLDRTQTLDFIAPLQGSVGVSFTRLPEALRVAPVSGTDHVDGQHPQTCPYRFDHQLI